MRRNRAEAHGKSYETKRFRLINFGRQMSCAGSGWTHFAASAPVAAKRSSMRCRSRKCSQLAHARLGCARRCAMGMHPAMRGDTHTAMREVYARWLAGWGAHGGAQRPARGGAHWVCIEAGAGLARRGRPGEAQWRARGFRQLCEHVVRWSLPSSACSTGCISRTTRHAKGADHLAAKERRDRRAIP